MKKLFLFLVIAATMLFAIPTQALIGNQMFAEKANAVYPPSTLTLAANGDGTVGLDGLDGYVDYHNSLQTQEGFNEMTVIDANGGSTWQFDNSNRTHYKWHAYNPGDDWLITPALQMKAGETYTVEFQVKSGTFAESFEVKAGTALTADNLSAGTQVIANTTIQNINYSTYSGTFTPTVDGSYYIGIHCTSVKNQFILYVQDLSVSHVMLPDGVMAYEENGKAVDGKYYIVPGTEVTVTATPSEGHYLSAWSGIADGDTNTDLKRTFTVGDDDMTVTATFTPYPVLTLAANGDGTVGLDGLDGYVDYHNSLQTQEGFNEMTVIDANGNDGNSGTWIYGADNRVTYYLYTQNNPGDDWLITPALQMKAGETYTVEFQAKCSTTYAESFEVKAGTALTADNLSAGTQVIANTTVKSTYYSTYSGTFTPTADGSYYIGIHCTSEKNQFVLYVQDLSVSSGTQPAGVTVYEENGQTVDGKYRVAPGTEVTVTATPSEGHYLSAWSGIADGDTDTDLKRTFTVGDDDMTVSATFTQCPTLTLAANGNGTVVLDGYVDYHNSLTTQEGFDEMTVIDVNGHTIEDNYKKGTWQFANDGTFYYRDNSKYADDWLITPAFEMKAGATYTVEFQACSNGPNFPESFEVKAGTALTANNLLAGTQVIAKTTVDSKSYTTYSGTFTPTADGTYYIGIHCTSNPSMFALIVQDLAITSGTLPDGVTPYEENGQTVSGKFNVKPGTEVTVKATPDKAHYLSAWSGIADGDTNTDLTRTFTLVDNMTVSATFTQCPTLTLATNGNGTVGIEDHIDYHNSLTTQEGFDEMTVIDANGHTTENNYKRGTWQFISGDTFYYDNEDQPGDDWLVAPALQMKAGVTYTIEFQASIFSINSLLTESFEVKAGTALTADNLSAGTQVIAKNHVSSNSYTTYGGTFTPTADGTYYIGIHCVSIRNRDILLVKDLAITGGLPDGVTPYEENGQTVNGKFNVKPGTEVPVKATPDKANYLSAWSGIANDDTNTDETRTFTLADDMTVTATFTQCPVLTLAANGNGTVGLDGYVDYHNSLTTQEGFDEMTVIDVNGHDENGNHLLGAWQFVNNETLYRCNSSKPGDDWLIAPALQMKAGVAYTVEFQARGTGSYYPESFEVKAGTAATADNLSAGTQVIAQTTVDSKSYTTYSGTFTPTADGTYYIGIHCISAPKMWVLIVKDLAITGQPDGVTAYEENGQTVADKYYVAPGAEVPVKATANEDNHVAGWTDADDAEYTTGVTYSDYTITSPSDMFPIKSKLTLTMGSADAIAQANFSPNGYLVTVPAGDYITYYSDKPLKLLDTETDAKLYTITEVDDNTATISQLSSASAGTPLLVYNGSNAEKSILLQIAPAPATATAFAPEFVGSLTATTIAASTDTQNNYALNGRQFVWVKDALSTEANKCWLALGASRASALDIVSGGATSTPSANKYQLAAIADPDGRGTISFSVSGNTASEAAEGEVVTVTVSPATGYVVNQPAGQWTTVVAAARRANATNGTIAVADSISLTPAGENAWTFTMIRADATLTATYKKQLSHQDISIEAIEDITYDGLSHTPIITVKDGTTDITGQCGFGYNGDPVNVGTVNVTISVPSTNDDYAGEINTSYKIVAKQLKITAQSHEFTYNGKTQSWSEYDVDGLVGNDAVSAVVTGSILFPSESPVANELTSYAFTTGTPGNYSVQTIDGELTMVNASQAITITAASASWTYDGEAHANASVTITSGSLLTGDELVATATGSVTNVADTQVSNNPIAEGYKVMHGTEDVTASYVITPVNGTLTITRADIPEEDITAPVGIENLLFANEAQALIEAGSVKDNIGTMEYSTDGVNFSEEIPTGTAAGEYTIYYRVVGDDNHNDVEAQQLTTPVLILDITDIIELLRAETELAKMLFLSLGDAMPEKTLEEMFYTIGAADVLLKEYDRGNEVSNAEAMELYLKLKAFNALFDEITTAITDNSRETTTDNRYFDLNGRLIQGKPTKKGVYLLNGKKVVVK